MEVSTAAGPVQVCTPEPVPSLQENTELTDWLCAKCSPSAGVVILIVGAARSGGGAVDDVSVSIANGPVTLPSTAENEPPA